MVTRYCTAAGKFLNFNKTTATLFGQSTLNIAHIICPCQLSTCTTTVTKLVCQNQNLSRTVARCIPHQKNEYNQASRLIFSLHSANDPKYFTRTLHQSSSVVAESITELQSKLYHGQVKYPQFCEPDALAILVFARRPSRHPRK